MTDIGLFLEDNMIKPRLEDGDLAGDDTLETSVFISLFTDRRASLEELPPGHTRRRGWWGDIYSEVPGDQIGSKIWTLDRSKVTSETLALFETRAYDGLRWMEEDGVASSVTVECGIDDEKRILLTIRIQRPDRTEPEKYGLIWDAQEIKRA